MQVFLPIYEKTNGFITNFKLSLQCLDKKRLCKQRVEAKQIIDINSNNTKISRWRNHPTTKMWRNYTPLLKIYYNISLDVFDRRGGNNINLKPYKDDKIDGKAYELLPEWLGGFTFHASHRSNLLFKGEVDRIVKAISFYLEKPYSQWHKEYHLPAKNSIKLNEYKKLMEIFYSDFYFLLPDLTENYYRKFNWLEPIGLPYYWP